MAKSYSTTDIITQMGGRPGQRRSQPAPSEGGKGSRTSPWSGVSELIRFFKERETEDKQLDTEKKDKRAAKRDSSSRKTKRMDMIGMLLLDPPSRRASDASAPLATLPTPADAASASSVANSATRGAAEASLRRSSKRGTKEKTHGRSKEANRERDRELNREQQQQQALQLQPSPSSPPEQLLHTREARDEGGYLLSPRSTGGPPKKTKEDKKCTTPRDRGDRPTGALPPVPAATTPSSATNEPLLSPRGSSLSRDHHRHRHRHRHALSPTLSSSLPSFPSLAASAPPSFNNPSLLDPNHSSVSGSSSFVVSSPLAMSESVSSTRPPADQDPLSPSDDVVHSLQSVTTSAHLPSLDQAAAAAQPCPPLNDDHEGRMPSWGIIVRIHVLTMLPEQQSISNFLHEGTPEQKPSTDGDAFPPPPKAESPRPERLPLQTQHQLLAVTLEASTCRLALFTQLRFAILASLPFSPNNGGTADANADGMVRRVLRTGGLVSRSGGHCFPLSWLAQRPAAFTDEPYTLVLQLPAHLNRQRNVLVTLVGAAEEAARRLDYATAVERYGEAIGMDGTLPYLHLRRCAALTQLRRLPQALVDADTAVALAPTWWLARLRRALCLVALGEVVPAAEELKQARALSETQLTPTAAVHLQRLAADLETARLASLVPCAGPAATDHLNLAA